MSQREKIFISRRNRARAKTKVLLLGENFHALWTLGDENKNPKTKGENSKHTVWFFLPLLRLWEKRKWCTWHSTGARRSQSWSIHGRPILGWVTFWVYLHASSLPHSTSTSTIAGFSSSSSPATGGDRRRRSGSRFWWAPVEIRGDWGLSWRKRFCLVWTRGSGICWCWR